MYCCLEAYNFGRCGCPLPVNVNSNLLSVLFDCQDYSKLKELCHGVFIHFSDLTKLSSH